MQEMVGPKAPHCPYCNLVVALFDRQRIRIPGTLLLAHRSCMEAAMNNARENPNERMPPLPQSS